MPVGSADLERALGVKRDAARRALRSPEAAGMVAVSRPDGRKPAVSVLDVAAEGRPRELLYGPILRA